MKTPSLACLLAPVALLAACATGGAQRSSEPAQLEVLNRTDTDMWVELRGRIEGTVRAGERARRAVELADAEPT